jgi:hypothetical protein
MSSSTLFIDRILEFFYFFFEIQNNTDQSENVACQQMVGTDRFSSGGVVNYRPIPTSAGGRSLDYVQQFTYMVTNTVLHYKLYYS